MKKKLSILLVLVLLLTSLPWDVALASSSDSNEDNIIGDELLEGMMLVNTDTVTVLDDEGNQFDVLVEEYVEPLGELEEHINDIVPASLFPEYKVGTKKTWVFKISNAHLKLTGIAKGVPLSAAAKKRLTDAIVKLIG